MTEPVNDAGRETRLVPVKGRTIVVRKLTDTQMVHLLRHSRILESDNVAKEQKLDSVERLFRILHTVIVQDEDKVFLDQQEEAGEIELADLMGFITAFTSEEEPEKPKARRGRPPKSLQR